MVFVDLIEMGRIYDKDMYGLWEDIVLDSRVQKDVLVKQIILQNAQALPCINTYYGFKQQSDAWFRKWDYQISKLLDTQEFEYNPIWNKDGTVKEDRTIERELNREENVGDDFSETTDSDSDGTVENTVSADNSSSYQPRDKAISNAINHEKTTNSRDIDKKANEGEVTGDHFMRIEQGNIGVTTTQQMINEERALYEFNIYNWIIEHYTEELFLRVY